VNKSGLVYMLSTGPYVKLGYTGQTSLDSRLKQIRNACPYDIAVLAARPATYEQEQELHAGAIQWRHPTREKSDWYLDCPELRRYCDAFFFADREITSEVVSEHHEGAPLMEPETL
jgi:hypothetical protein